MKIRFKKLIASVLAVSLVLPSITTEVFADTTTPGAYAPSGASNSLGALTSGGQSFMKGTGVFVKAYFDSPSNYGIRELNEKEKDNINYKGYKSGYNYDYIKTSSSKVSWQTKDNLFSSATERMLFSKATGTKINTKTNNIENSFKKEKDFTNGMTKPNYTKSGEDSYRITQMYSFGTEKDSLGFDKIVFLGYDKSNDLHLSNYAEHRVIDADNMSGTSGAPYKDSGHLFSLNTAYMKKLLKATSNGTTWDSAKINKAIEEIFKDYVNPSTGNFSSSSIGVRLRKDVASMFYDKDSWVDAAYYFDTFMDSIKKGKKPLGLDFTIKNKEQVGIIQNLWLIQFGLVLCNPAQGTTIGGKVIGKESYKDEYLKNNIKTWVTNGGNADSNSKDHFVIKFEAYSYRTKKYKDMYQFYRYDVALGSSFEGGSWSTFNVIPGYNKSLSSESRYTYGEAMTNDDNRNSILKKHLKAVIKFRDGLKLSNYIKHNSDYNNISSSGKPSNSWNSLWSWFQSVYYWRNPNPESDWMVTKTVNKKLLNRTICLYHTPIFGNEVIDVGYTYFAPAYPVPDPEEGTSKGNNFKMNAELKYSGKTKLDKESKIEITTKFNLKWPKQLEEKELNKYKISVSDTAWYTQKREKIILSKLIYRATYNNGNQLASKTNKDIPITIKIKRVVTNGHSKNKDKKITDELTHARLQHLKNHHGFKVVSDDGETAVIKFNLISDTGKCSIANAKNEITSPITEKKVNIQNCVIQYLMGADATPFVIVDKDINITEKPSSKTTVRYIFSYSVDFPTFKENIEAYGDSETDLARNLGKVVARGYSEKPKNGKVYPYSDYTEDSKEVKYWMSSKIARSTTVKTKPDTIVDPPVFYSNLGYEQNNPHYAEIKTNTPTNETFEAMSGTPTTRDLYTSVSGTDFRVQFEAKGKEVENGQTYRTYTYTVNINNCWEENEKCNGSCPGPKYNDKGALVHPKHNKLPCGGYPCDDSKTVNQWHPHNHTWTYTIKIPINSFTYFDMKDTELWRLTSWGIKSEDSFLTKLNPTYNMNTKAWAFNGGNYSSGNGRIIFNTSQNGNTQGDKAQWGNNSRSTTFSNNTRAELAKQALEWVNNAVKAEGDLTGSIISDYIVLKTSEGYQVPYFYSQDFANSIKISSYANFSQTKNGNVNEVITTEPLSVDKKLTFSDFWKNNKDKLTCASEENGWTNDSITYGGYNGKFQSLDTKYKNDKHDIFINAENPLEKLLKKMNWSIDRYYPNQVSDGSGNVTFGKDYDNKEHIKTGVDIIDTYPNGQVDTGEAWVKYERFMLYSNNKKLDPKSSKDYEFESTSSGIYEIDNVPYSSNTDKINNIVLHNPVSAEYAVVVSNPSKYDLRTNAELMQGGDPVGITDGVCPLEGCLYSTLSCTEELKPHTDDCYEIVQESASHVGGNNVHVHTEECYKVTFPANIEGLSVSSDLFKEYALDTTHQYNIIRHDSGCSYSNEYHLYDATDRRCLGCTHSCGFSIIKSNVTITDFQCSGLPNEHKCTDACNFTYSKELICTNPHHYTPGEPTDRTDPKYHYELGDSRCWTRCGDDSKHSTPTEVTLPNGGTASMGGTFINLDREFQIYFPFVGDFAENPSLEAIEDTTIVRGKGLVNSMNTREWTEHRWVTFPVNVIDPAGKMRLAGESIDLNEFSSTQELFTFYCVLANSELASEAVTFTAVAINSPNQDKSEYYTESTGVTNKERVDDIYAARHTADKLHYIDVVGYIGGLTINDTGDFRFSNLFKMKANNNKWLIPGLVPEVDLTKPNYLVSDTINVRQDEISKRTHWLDVYGLLFNKTGGKSGGTDYLKNPFRLPLVPAYNNIESLRNQPMRPGYSLYMDVETVGNYYGVNYDGINGVHLDTDMIQKMQIRPLYYSLNLDNGEYTPVDVWFGVNGEYKQVYDYDFNNTDSDGTGITDYYYYLDWLNESYRRNYTEKEKEATLNAKKLIESYGTSARIPSSQRDILGSANVLFLNDLNKTYNGSSKTYSSNKNPGNRLTEAEYNRQGQRWHFTLGLPSSSVFVESNQPCTDINIKKLQTSNRVIVCALDIKVQGEVWTLQYDGTENNSKGFQIFEGGKTYNPPTLDGGDKPVVVVYPPDKTSKDDVDIQGIQ